MGLLGLLLFQRQPRRPVASDRREPGAGRCRRHIAEPPFGRADDIFVADVAGHGEHGVRRHVLAAKVGVDGRDRQRGDGFGRAADVPPERLVRPECLIDKDRGEFARAVFDAGQLLEDDGPLLFQFRRVHHGVAHHVGQDVDGLKRGGVGHLGVVDRDLAVGGGVVGPADRLDGLGDFARCGPPGRP